MPKIYILDVCKHILNLQQEIDSESASTGGYNADTGTLLGDCCDYCMYHVLDLLGTKPKTELRKDILEIQECEALCNSKGDMLHTGLFFTLGQMLALKYEVKMLPNEAITRKNFEDSWQKTRRELGL